MGLRCCISCSSESAAVLLQFDAGSCIDGRLTSAWNWGSKIEKKEYYHIFKICGFVGATLPLFHVLHFRSMLANHCACKSAPKDFCRPLSIHLAADHVCLVL